MKEERDKNFPKNMEEYGKTGAYAIYVSKETGELIVDTTDYHPGALYFDKKDLEDILKKLKETDSGVPEVGKHGFIPASVTELRNKLGITQARLAEIIGTTPTSINNWERGRGGPNGYACDVLWRLAESNGLEIEFYKHDIKQ